MDELNQIQAGPDNVDDHGHGEQHVALRHGEAESVLINIKILLYRKHYQCNAVQNLPTIQIIFNSKIRVNFDLKQV